MKLKGLVWFFTIILFLISVYQLSFTWVANNFENKLKSKAERIVSLTSPELKANAKQDAVLKLYRHYSDSLQDEKIYPGLGFTFMECKENELQLGLDLQGGMSVTMNVDLEGVLKSLSNNPKDPDLIKAINTTNSRKVASNTDYITLFTQVWKEQNPGKPLASIFGGANKDIQITDDDQKVLQQLQTTAESAITQTYKIILKRVDQFGVASAPVNLDLTRGTINVELPGVQDPERVRHLLQASAHLQFWEVYNIGDIGNDIDRADKALANYLSGVNIDTTKAGTDSLNQAIDSAKLLANEHPLASVIHFIGPQQNQNGQPSYYPAIANVSLADTAVANKYLRMDLVKANFPGNIKFLYGREIKNEKSNQRYFELYAIKTVPGTDKAKLEGEGVSTSSQGFDDRGRPDINMKMTPNGARIWARMTKDNVGKPLAIVLDDIVYSAPNVNGAIEGGSSEISGGFTVLEAKDLASILKIGKIDAPARIVQQQVVGPTLGLKALKGGGIAFLIAFLVIFAFMLLNYNNGGWIANIALLFNMLFTIGILAALGASLTAAGIAGLVLTIGMAVDGNVIIFERIKEELARGKSYQLAIHDGYRRSYNPVIDSQVTGLLTAGILFYFGLGPVLGFATTQLLGLSIALFTSILVSRLITEMWMNKERHFKYVTKFSKKIFRETHIKFMEHRKFAYGISVIVLILGLGTYFNGFNKGVEFEGGRSFTVEFPQNVNVENLRGELQKSFDGESVVIKTVGDHRHLDITTSYMIGVNGADSLIQARLFAGLQDKLAPGTTLASFVKNNIQSTQTVQPVISKDLKRGAIKAVIFGILAIVLYILLRFRDWRYSAGAIVGLLHDVLVMLIVFSYFKDIVPFPLELNQHFIAAILTTVGFSINDTVVEYDRMRENGNLFPNLDKLTIINLSINETLSRTIITSLTVFLTVLALFIFGGEVTRGFSFAMMIGVVVGTYSSVFVSTPFLVDFAKDKPLGKANLRREKAVATSEKARKAKLIK